MRKRMRPIGLSPILQGMSKNLGLEKGMIFYHLKTRWPDLVGQPIASHTAPDKIRFSTLTLLVDGAAWMHELTFFKEEILQKINGKLSGKLGKNAIRTLHLKLGQLPKKTDSPTNNPPPSLQNLSRQEASLIRQNLSSISDQALKKVIEKAMMQHLRKKESSAAGNQLLE